MKPSDLTWDMCPFCGALFQPTGARLIPDHKIELERTDEWQPCPGSGQHPRNPESDRWPLWGGKPNVHAASGATAVAPANPADLALALLEANGVRVQGKLWDVTRACTAGRPYLSPGRVAARYLYELIDHVLGVCPPGGGGRP
jgi:hypothetical protein